MEEKSERYSHILKYTGLFGGVQGLCALVGLVRNKLVVLLLGPEGMGLVSLFCSTIRWVSDSTNLGLSMSAVREVSTAYERGDMESLERSVSLIRLWSLLTALLGFVVCAALSPLLNRWTFTWGDHTLHFVLLSPVVALTAVTSGEVAILKGTRRLGRLAAISVYNVVLALLLSVPLYYFWHEAAIVPSLVLMAFGQMAVTMGYSWRLFPYRIGGKRREVRGERREERLLTRKEERGERRVPSFVYLGIAFAVAGIMGSGAELIIRGFLNNVDSLDAVGLYSAGYMMPMAYAGMVFSALDADYFPRLSGISGTGERLNETVNSQIEVCLLLLSPLLVVFLFALPILLPLFYSGKFLPVLGMMQVMTVSLFFRALNLPMSYLPLSKGHSGSYLLMEGGYDVAVVIAVVLGFSRGGLTGAGVGVLSATLFDFLMLSFYMRWRYGYRFSKGVLCYVAVQLPILLVAYAATFCESQLIYWLMALLFSLCSALVSICILHRKFHLVDHLIIKMRSKWRR